MKKGKSYININGASVTANDGYQWLCMAMA